MIVFEKLIVWKESCIYARGEDRYFQRMVNGKAMKEISFVFCRCDAVRELNNDVKEKF